MTEFRHDPKSLAERLDQLLPPGQPQQIGTDSDPLIEAAARVASVPRPSLSADAMAQIQMRMMQAQPVPPRISARIPSSGRLALVAALTVLLIAGTVFAAHELGITLIAPNTPTATPTFTSSPTPSATVSHTPSASVTPTFTQLPTEPIAPTPEALIIVSPSAAIVATPTVAVESAVLTPAPTDLPVTLIVEGPVQAINVNIITIYDIDITINADDPMIAQIQIGDFVRVEGDVLEGVNSTVVIGINVFVVEPDVVVGNNNAVVWQDNGNCSNPPPPWAPAHGWRARCEGAPRPGNSGQDDSDDDEGMGMGD